MLRSHSKAKYFLLGFLPMLFMALIYSTSMATQNDTTLTPTLSASPTSTSTLDPSITPFIYCPTLTPTPSITPNPLTPTITPTSDGSTYIIQTGDTLYGIAQNFDVDLDELIAINEIENPSRVPVGTVLILPTSETESVSMLETATVPYIVQETNCSTLPAAEVLSSTWYVNTPLRLNVRDCPSEACDTLTSFAYRTAIEVISTTTDGWHEIVLDDGTIGYVYSTLTSQTQPPAILQPQATDPSIPTTTMIADQGGNGNGNGSTNFVATLVPTASLVPGIPNTETPLEVRVSISLNCTNNILTINVSGFLPTDPQIVTYEVLANGGRVTSGQIFINTDGTGTASNIDVGNYVPATYTVGLSVTVSPVTFSAPCP